MAAHFEPDWQLDRFLAFDVGSNFTFIHCVADCSLGQVSHVYTTVPLGIPELSSIFN